jgi:hypothetical protein
MLEMERGNTTPHSAEKSLWKWRWTCCKADNGMNERMNEYIYDKLKILVVCRGENCTAVRKHQSVLIVRIMLNTTKHVKNLSRF